MTIKSEKTGNRAVLKEDIIKFEQMTLVENSGSWKAVNYFLLSFYLVGMSFTDLAYLRTENIVNGRIYSNEEKHIKIIQLNFLSSLKVLLRSSIF